MLILHQRILYLLIIAYPVFYLGIGNKYPWILLGKNGSNLGIIFFFGVNALFITSALCIKLEKIPPKKLALTFKINVLISLIFTLLYDFIQYHHFRSLGYRSPILLYLISIISIFTLMTTINKSRIKSSFKIICIFVALHTLLSIFYFPLAVERSDMLGAIMVALQQFFNNADPYQHVMSNIGVPAYLPMTILSFTPAFFLKLDPRIIGLFYTIIFLYLIYIKIDKLKLLNQYAICLIILNPYWLMRHDLYFQFFILELVIILLYSYNYFYRILIWGFTLATSQFAIILLPFFCLAKAKTIIHAVREVILILIIAALIIISFAHNNLYSFFNAISQHREYTLPYNSDITFGISPIFHFTKNQIGLYIVQIIGCMLILCFSIYQFIVNKERDSNYYIASGIMCFFYFMITNYFLETYLYIPLLITIALANTKTK
jgi:hypothetical protein